MVHTFTLDGSAHIYEAVSFGPRWNGWVTPVVTRDTLIELIDNEGDHGKYLHLGWYGPTAIVTMLEAGGSDQQIYPLGELSGGLFDLGELGWTFFTPNETE